VETEPGATADLSGGKRRSQESGRGPGDRVGRYVILSVIGSGGMGTVYAAHDPQLDRKVALKFLHSGVSEEAQARLYREAQAMARLPHPNVVPVHDVGTDRGDVFVAMEFVDGGTVVEWLDAEKRSWREILRVFLEAGRGLAAAHAAGLVHRDFKPNNVLVDRSGRVLVTDFGLACLEGRDAEPPVAPSRPAHDSSSLATPLTQAGSILGTPAFMAPEQFAGGADARSDQFAFCVSLYWALYRQFPFDKRTDEKLPPLREAPPHARVPRWLRSVILRGLSADVEARFPSMDALLSALSYDPDRIRRRWLSVVAAGTLIVAAVGVTYHARRQQQSLCTGSTQLLAGVWNDSRRDGVHRAFSATGTPYAERVFQTVRDALDGYARRWVAMRTDACEATRVRGEQSEELLDLRMDCLAEKREELRALVDVFAQADASVVEKAVHAASGLGELDACANAAALKSPVRPPTDARVRSQVEAVRTQLARAKALEEAGRYPDGLTVASVAVTEATRIGYRPLEAEARVRLGSLQDRNGKQPESEETLIDAVAQAQTVRHDEAAAQALVKLVLVDYRQARYREAHHYATLAKATLDRAGSDALERATLFSNRGNVYWDEGKNEEAREQYAAALALREKKLGPEHPEVAMTLDNLANVLFAQARYEQAMEYHRRALAILEKTLGPDHPDVALALSNIAINLLERGQWDDRVLAYHRRALAIWERAEGPEHPDLALALNGIGDVLARQGRYDEAIASYQRALAVLEKAVGPEHPDVAVSLQGLGELLFRQGKYDQASARYRRALAIREKASGPDSAMIAEVVNGLGAVSIAQGRYDQALAFYERACAISEKALGAAHPDVAVSLTGEGRALVGLNAAARAMALLERALSIYERAPRTPWDLADTRFALARALVAVHGDRERARSLAVEARASYASGGAWTQGQLAAVDGWLRGR
jgi:tetratricopeptide (TPR) repeat protein